jgi:uncharacterized iron-regulated membrane protein
MTVRKAIFWTHLGAGVMASVVVFMMSLTGVILTYERQIKEWADLGEYPVETGGRERLDADELLRAVRLQDPGLAISSIALHSRPDALPLASQGRRGQQYLDPCTGEILGPGNSSVRNFFSTMMGWHRWFNLAGESRATGRAITGAANLLFLYLIVTGIYLWLPPLLRWAVFRQRIFFNKRAKSAKARDYNWHHVFGFWIFAPLFLIVLSATPISYTWARNTVYRVVGEPVPERDASVRLAPETSQLATGATVLPLQTFVDTAAANSGNWRRIDVFVPTESATTVSVAVDQGSGGEPHRKRTLTFDRVTGEIVATQTFADRTPGGKVLSYFRWVHTGEAHGLIGQTVAGIVSALAGLMVWTGVALSYRRLLQPIIRRRRLRH